MNKHALITLLALLCLTDVSFAMTVYQTNTDITSQAGGVRYWASSQTAGSNPVDTTRVRQDEDSSGPDYYYIPGQTATDSTGTIGTAPAGYGWATNFLLGGDIPAGQWTFRVTTRNTRSQINPAYIGVNVFRYCNGTNTRLFYVQGPNFGGTSSIAEQNITSSHAGFTAAGCRLKFEYWLTADSDEDNTNTLYNVNSNKFSVTFPDPSGSACQNSTEVCNGVDDNCNGQTDEGCQNQTCSPGLVRPCGLNAGACVGGLQTCLANMTWGVCTGPPPSAEVCNNIDDDCDGQTDEALSAACGLNAGVCRQGTSYCRSGTWSTCENETRPAAETCDYRDNDCDGQTDEGSVCLTNTAQRCAENWTCGEWSTCNEAEYGIRNCTDRAGCGTSYYRPALTRICNSNTTIASAAAPAGDDTGQLYMTIYVFIAIVIAASLFIAKMAG